MAMSDKKQDLNDKKIDVSEIDWNKLSVEDFHSLSNVFAERDKILKENKKRKQRDNGDKKPVVIDGKTYMVKSILISKYKNMKSQKSKEKFLNEIKSQSEEITNI